jgi:acyl-CoA synthetase (AMP-forming)/AMP-acid ligase II
MLITEILARNARMHPHETALIERTPIERRRLEIDWRQFDQAANRFANALILRGVKKSDRVTHLMLNCIEWLPAYFGILRSGAWAVPLNFRFEAEVIGLCAEVAEPRVFLFGAEFIDRIRETRGVLDQSVEHYVYLGAEELCPDFAERYEDFIAGAPDRDPRVPLEISDDAALYFTSGTTGMPKAVRLTHRNLEHACYLENQHHRQTRHDTFLCIPPLYHTGAKMH